MVLTFFFYGCFLFLRNMKEYSPDLHKDWPNKTGFRCSLCCFFPSLVMPYNFINIDPMNILLNIELTLSSISIQ